jgi:hypothetical protein
METLAYAVMSWPVQIDGIGVTAILMVLANGVLSGLDKRCYAVAFGVRVVEVEALGTVVALDSDLGRGNGGNIGAKEDDHSEENVSCSLFIRHKCSRLLGEVTVRRARSNSGRIGWPLYDLRRNIAPRRKLRGGFLFGFFGLASPGISVSHGYMLAPMSRS